MKGRLDMGFTFLKMDLGIRLLRDTPNTLTRPIGMTRWEERNTMHFFTGIEITPKGIGMMADYVAAVRDGIGMEVPLAADHFGHIGVNSCIKLGKALEPYNMAWLEDMIPWQFPEQWKQITDAIDVPTLTGEDIYLKEGFMPLFEKRAVAVIHPDLASSGGILETKKIGDLAQEHGIAMALHMAMSPVAALAAVHCAAATENFLALENHSVDDLERWSSLVEGRPDPLIEAGHIAVPEMPGLGFTGLNEDVMGQFVDPEEPGIFPPSAEWDGETAHDRLWS